MWNWSREWLKEGIYLDLDGREHSKKNVWTTIVETKDKTIESSWKDKTLQRKRYAIKLLNINNVVGAWI